MARHQTRNNSSRDKSNTAQMLIVGAPMCLYNKFRAFQQLTCPNELRLDSRRYVNKAGNEPGCVCEKAGVLGKVLSFMGARRVSWRCQQNAVV